VQAPEGRGVDSMLVLDLVEAGVGIVVVVWEVWVCLTSRILLVAGAALSSLASVVSQHPISCLFLLTEKRSYWYWSNGLLPLEQLPKHPSSRVRRFNHPSLPGWSMGIIWIDHKFVGYFRFLDPFSCWFSIVHSCLVGFDSGIRHLESDGGDGDGDGEGRMNSKTASSVLCPDNTICRPTRGCTHTS
jgi:hypothetical protein